MTLGLCLPSSELDQDNAQAQCLINWVDCRVLVKEEMATHSSMVAWTIPWTEEPGGLQSMGLQRVGHD